jgi:hypothetical protein
MLGCLRCLSSLPSDIQVTSTYIHTAPTTGSSTNLTAWSSLIYQSMNWERNRPISVRRWTVSCSSSIPQSRATLRANRSRTPSRLSSRAKSKTSLEVAYNFANRNNPWTSSFKCSSSSSSKQTLHYRQPRPSQKKLVTMSLPQQEQLSQPPSVQN